LKPDPILWKIMSRMTVKTSRRRRSSRHMKRQNRMPLTSVAVLRVEDIATESEVEPKVAGTATESEVEPKVADTATGKETIPSDEVLVLRFSIVDQ
jgi:hypothetical protein